jgi:hypothetical protein
MPLRLLLLLHAHGSLKTGSPGKRLCGHLPKPCGVTSERHAPRSRQATSREGPQTFNLIHHTLRAAQGFRGRLLSQ